MFSNPAGFGFLVKDYRIKRMVNSLKIPPLTITVYTRVQDEKFWFFIGASERGCSLIREPSFKNRSLVKIYLPYGDRLIYGSMCIVL